MRSLDRRPLGTFASAFFVSLCVIYQFGTWLNWFILISFAAFAAVFFFYDKIPYRLAFTAILAAIFTASLYSVYVLDVKLDDNKSLAGKEREITGTVLSVRYASTWEGCYTVNTNGTDVLLYFDNGELKAGDIVSCTVLYNDLEFSDTMNESFLAGGIFLQAEAVGHVSVVGIDKGLRVRIAEFQQALSARLRSFMSPESGGFSAALILGDRSHLSDETARDFRTLGLSHVLALSGTHLAVIFSLADRFIPETRKILRLLILCPAVMFYMFLTGLSPSVVRAGIMLIVSSIASAVNRNADSFTSLSVSVSVICLLNPFAPYDVGLQLSYLSVLGIIVSLRLVRYLTEGKYALFKIVVSILLPAFLVPIAVLPIMWLRFGEVSLLSPAANIVLVPVASFLIPILLLILLLSPFTVVFLPLVSATDVVVSLFLRVVGTAADITDPVLPLNGVLTAVFAFLFIVVMPLPILLCGKYRIISASAGAMILGLMLVSAQGYVCLYNSGMTICFASSDTDEAVCAVSDGSSILIDIGRYPTALKEAAKLGALYGSGRIDSLVLTHLHQSHVLTLSEICSNYYIGSLWLPASSDPDYIDISYNLSEYADNNGITVYTYVPGERLTFGSGVLYAPSAEYNGYSEHPSVSFTLEYEEETFVYSPSDRESGCVSDGSVNIVGTHGPVPSGMLRGDSDGQILISPEGAAMFDCVSDTVSVTKQAVFRFRHGKAPLLTLYSRE